jgi:hypothetical protein
MAKKRHSAICTRAQGKTKKNATARVEALVTKMTEALTAEEKPAPIATAEQKLKGAKNMNRPSLNAAMIIQAFQPGLIDADTGVNFTPGVDELSADLLKRSQEVVGGDMTLPESMLMSQSYALQAMFTHYARLARTAEGLDTAQTLATLALKAQGQCRATLQTLVEVKYPRQVQFVKQQNIAGNQQVNNGGEVPALPRAEKDLLPSNELLEKFNDAERLDAGAQSATSGVNLSVVPLVAVKRA